MLNALVTVVWSEHSIKFSFAGQAVSAKSYDFNEKGDETKIDYAKMLRIVKDAGYSGFIGIEYEGERLSEVEGITATKNLLINTAKKLN